MSAAGEPNGAGVSPEELASLQAAEEAKSDPALDEVDPAEIEVADEKEDSFDKLAAAAKRLSPDRVRTIVETLLFLAEKPLMVEEIRQASGVEAERIEKALDQLTGHYREGPCGVVLHEVAGGWQLRSSPDNSAFARRFLKVKPQRLTRAALETLAIIAYRQPVTRPEVEEIRGVDCGAVVKALLERKLIKILGKKEEPGRPILYGTSREFLEFFALKDLASLPTLREFHELSQEHREIVEKVPEAPIEGIVDALADPTLQAQLDAKRAESDAALEELEAAMARAETTTKELGSKVDPSRDLVLVDNQPVEKNAARRYILLYKPPGCVTTLSDPQGRPTARGYLGGVQERVFPVGRLDYDAEGALLFTDDGELANRLAHPRYGHRRIYLVKTKGMPEEAALRRMVEGVRLEDGPAQALSAEVHEQAEKNTWIKIVVGEGRFHLVKRLCESVGLPVLRLYRPEFGGVTVARLRPGHWRDLTDEEVGGMMAAVGMTGGGEARRTPLAQDLPKAGRRHGHGPPSQGAPKPTPGEAGRTERGERGEPKERGARGGRDERGRSGARGGRAAPGSRPEQAGARGAPERKGRPAHGGRPTRQERRDRPRGTRGGK
jgi:segregation and condensation protein B